jgi:hypothetical protein
MSELLSPESLLNFKEMIIAIISREDSVYLALNHRVQQDTVLNYTRSHTTQALAPDSFFAGMMNVVEPTNLRPQSMSTVTPTFVSVGAVSEGDDTVHVIVRVSVYVKTEDVSLTAVTLLSLKRMDNQWRVILPDDMSSKATVRLQEPRLSPR